MGEIQRSDVVEYFESKSANAVEVDEAVSDLSNRYGVDEDDARVALMGETSMEFTEDGEAVARLDEEVTPEDMEEDAQSGGAAGRIDEAGEIQTPDNSEAVDMRAWDTGFESDMMQIGKMDKETGAPTGDEFYHLSVRENVDHPLVPDVSEFIPQEKEGGVSNIEMFTARVADPDFGVMLVGEPGVGKGHLTRYAASRVNAPLVRINMGIGITKDKLIGRFVPKGDGDLEDQLDQAKEIADEQELPVEKVLEMMNIRSKFEWRDGLLTTAVKNGYWFLADEVNAADPEQLLPLNGLLEDRGSRTLEISDKGESIKPHPGFRMIATRNPRHHRGVRRLNHAWKDRMYEMRVDYLPAEKEIEMLADREPVDEDQAAKIVKFAQKVRSAYPSEIQHKTLTFRGCQRIARDTNLFGLRTAVENEMMQGFDEYHAESASGQDAGNAVKRRIEQVFDD